MTTKDFNFPIKIINKEDIEKYILTLKNNEKQLLITDSGIYLTNGNKETKEIIKKTDLDLGEEKLLTSSKTIKGAINEVFQKSYRGKELVANAVGDMNLATQSYVKISNFILENKKEIVKALNDKGIITDVKHSLSDYAKQIEMISQNMKLKNTKLNMQKGEVKKIKLNKPIKIEQCCTSVFEYITGNDNVICYNCDFNNGDKSNFNFDSTIEFKEGLMKQRNKEVKNEMFYRSDNESYFFYSAKFNIDDFYNINDISVIQDDNNEKSFLNVKGTFIPTFVFANNDINLLNVDSIEKIQWSGNAEDNNKIKFVFSKDSGVSWESFNFKTNSIYNINIKNPKDFYNALNVQDLNLLNKKQLDKIFENSTKIRFGYYFDKLDADKKLNNDKISIYVNMQGKSIFTQNVTITLSEDHEYINYTILKDGTYTITWIDN